MPLSFHENAYDNNINEKYSHMRLCQVPLARKFRKKSRFFPLTACFSIIFSLLRLFFPCFLLFYFYFLIVIMQADRKTYGSEKNFVLPRGYSDEARRLYLPRFLWNRDLCRQGVEPAEKDVAVFSAVPGDARRSETAFSDQFH